MKITNDVFYIGVNDRKIDLFEGQFTVPNGMAYNSYLISDEKVAVLDTVDANFTDEWLRNLEEALGGRTPDYLIVQHMEPDHSANISNFMNKYENVQIIASAKAFSIMKNFFGTEYENRRITVKDGDTISLGEHTLSFIAAPMVHWPEVTVTYDEKDKILFSADAFGKFGATDTDEDWACEARRYYFGIVGKYGAQVQMLLKKLANKQIEKICPLHGPALRENIEYYTNLYNTWSSYMTESDGVAIAYTSVYGNTEKAVKELEKLLIENGCPKVAISDLTRCDMAEAVEDAFRYGKIILATTTYSGDIFPQMKEFINQLTERNFQNKFVGFVENGSWAATAANVMRKMLEPCKNITFAENAVHIKSALSDENKTELESVAKEFSE